MMPNQYSELAFETAIEDTLAAIGGYEKGDREGYDCGRGLFAQEVISFIKATQPIEWNYLEKLQKEKTEEVLLDDLCRALNSEHEGCLSVLRRGFKSFGKQFHMAYFAPASSMNPETQKLYAANHLTITRQVRYSDKHGGTLDVVLALNGIPIATVELKSRLTRQNCRNAVNQYKNDRDPNDLIFRFKKRSLVHFAVDEDDVYMTTRLSKGSTVFLPFNKGYGGGAGNPENPEGYKTAYLWEEVLVRESILDILGRFMHLQIEDKGPSGQKVRTETMIFPRYHQLDCVRKLVADARAKGAGMNYLVQHSAGSGKSNSIAWLAHRLASLYDENDEKVFDSVIVVTDRIVLDQQLQNAIYQLEHKQGVVKKIEEDSTQLANALSGGVPIVVTTLQKFPFITEKIGTLPKRKYAVIVDEAHSSQGGESAMELKGVLAGAAIQEEADKPDDEDGLQLDYEDEILKTMLARGKQPNLAFFAFTATPKYKTLEVFGQRGLNGKPEPFHLYSMRQAIEEGFILDVLDHYITYKAYYRLVKSVEDDPKVDKRKAARALARFMSLHPHNIAQKTEVMIEHFRHHTMHKIGNKAKAMVLTSNRLHAVRYKQEFDRYISEKRYEGIKTLVAFSGTVHDPDAPSIEYTEVKMNKGIREKELPERFSTGEYQVLIVAAKYQTGFDQPQLHTMYVDKRLAGIQAVQALSRLNRTHPGKEDTFVLDFANEAEDIRAAFQPYYEETVIGERAEAQQLYEMQAKLDSYQVYYKIEVEEFCKVFFKPKRTQLISDQARMNVCIDPAVNRFKDMDTEDREDFRKGLTSFRNLYSFLAQIIPFQDSDLEKLYTYIRFLLAKLPLEKGPIYRFDDDVSLKYYRLQKISEGSILLESGKVEPVPGPIAVGTGDALGEEIELSKLIDLLNERFGTDFKPGDQLFFESIREDAIADTNLQQAAIANTLENFGYVFRKALESLFIDRMEQNEEIVAKFINEKDFNQAVAQHLMKQVYEKIRTQSTG